MFQSTFPRGERHNPGFINSFTIAFQSTFPRGERLDREKISVELSTVSIHVPARGTTCLLPSDPSSPIVSIHVPARGTTTRADINDGFALFQSTFPRGERQQLPIIFIYSPCSFLCNYTNRFLSIQVLPPITTLFSLILYKYSGANLPGNTCLLAVRTHTLPHWPVRLFLINIFPVNALYKVHLDPSHSECRISSDMQSLCRIQPWDKRRQLPLVFHLSRHPTEIHFSIYTI